MGYHDILDPLHVVDTHPFCRCAEKLCEEICPSWPKRGDCVVRFVGSEKRPEVNDFDVGIEYMASVCAGEMMDACDRYGEVRSRPKSEFEFVRRVWP
jgi:hypothetical protein